MNRVNSWLWVGDQQDGLNVAGLQLNGINAVFNATPQSDNYSAETKAELRYLRLNQDDGAPIPLERLDLFAAWLGVQMARPCILLVHCGAGISRTAAFGALAMMLTSRASWDVAIAAIRAVRPNIVPSPVLVASVVEWWRARGGNEEALAGAR